MFSVPFQQDLLFVSTLQYSCRLYPFDMCQQFNCTHFRFTFTIANMTSTHDLHPLRALERLLGVQPIHCHVPSFANDARFIERIEVHVPQ